MIKKIVILLVIVLGIDASVNKMTGQVKREHAVGNVTTNSGLEYSVNLIYDGEGVAVGGSKDNNNYPTSIVGLGWHLSTPSIFVDNRNTADINDDQWFFEDDAGNVNEIIRTCEVSDNGVLISEKFHLVQNPYLKIRVIDNDPGDNEI